MEYQMLSSWLGGIFRQVIFSFEAESQRNDHQDAQLSDKLGVDVIWSKVETLLQDHFVGLKTAILEDQLQQVRTTSLIGHWNPAIIILCKFGQHQSALDVIE